MKKETNLPAFSEKLTMVLPYVEDLLALAEDAYRDEEYFYQRLYMVLAYVHEKARILFPDQALASWFTTLSFQVIVRMVMKLHPDKKINRALRKVASFNKEWSKP